MHTPRVLHVVRPAEGGMRAQVRSLIDGDPEAMLVSVPTVVAALSDLIPPERRQALSPPVGLLGRIRAGIWTGRWARRQGVQLVHGHGLQWSPLFMVAAHQARVPLVATLHNLVPQRIDPLSFQAARFFLARATGVIAVSQAVAHSARIVAPERLWVIPNGIDVDRFVDVAPLPRTGDLPHVLVVARLSPEKGIDLLLEALERMVHAAVLWIVGDGPARPMLERHARKSARCDRILFLGHREDIHACMATADFVCVPSRQEGLGLAALEAMASGKPVAAFAVGGLSEVIVDGETGALLPPEDCAALAATLDRWIEEPDTGRKLGAAGRQRVLKHFRRETMREETWRLYRRVLEGG